MPAGQQWLFAPAQPLVERLGREFFRTIPEQPGIYVMRDGSDEIVYVGKAKNLRNRLQSYRVANPERMPRRHLRLIREVARIDFVVCRSESAALAREASLLLELKPRFNRAGVWPGKTWFLTWRFTGGSLQMSLDEIAPLGWDRYGPLSGYARGLLGSLARLLWLGLSPRARFSQLPHGWAQDRFALPLKLACGARQTELGHVLDQLFWGEPEEFSAWLRASTEANSWSTFDQAGVQLDLDELESFASRNRNGRTRKAPQLALL